MEGRSVTEAAIHRALYHKCSENFGKTDWKYPVMKRH